VALINRHKVDIGILAYCNITLKEQSKKTILGFEKEVIKHDEIIEVISISGTYDFMLKIYAKDIDDYNRFVVNVIADMPNIGQYHSLFVLNEVKKSTAYILK
jgi:DNA-binding Lrp family transcriptional regulator